MPINHEPRDKARRVPLMGHRPIIRATVRLSERGVTARGMVSAAVHTPHQASLA